MKRRTQHNDDNDDTNDHPFATTLQDIEDTEVAWEGGIDVCMSRFVCVLFVWACKSESKIPLPSS